MNGELIMSIIQEPAPDGQLIVQKSPVRQQENLEDSDEYTYTMREEYTYIYDENDEDSSPRPVR